MSSRRAWGSGAAVSSSEEVFAAPPRSKRGAGGAPDSTGSGGFPVERDEPPVLLEVGALSRRALGAAPSLLVSLSPQRVASPSAGGGSGAAARDLVARCALATAYGALVITGYTLYRVLACNAAVLAFECHLRTGPQCWAEAMLLGVFSAVLYLTGPTWLRGGSAGSGAAAAAMGLAVDASTAASSGGDVWSPTRQQLQLQQQPALLSPQRQLLSPQRPLLPLLRSSGCQQLAQGAAGRKGGAWWLRRCLSVLLSRSSVAAMLFLGALFAWGGLGELSALHFSFAAGSAFGPLIIAVVVVIGAGTLAVFAAVVLAAWRAGEALVTLLLAVVCLLVYASAAAIEALDSPDPDTVVCRATFHPHHWLMTYQASILIRHFPPGAVGEGLWVLKWLLLGVMVQGWSAFGPASVLSSGIPPCLQ